MKSRWWQRSIVLLALAGNGSVVEAGANIARVPVSVRQSYAGGDYSVIDCRWGFTAPVAEQCALVVVENRRKSVFPIDLERYGYRFMSQDYRIFGNVRDGSFAFVLEVACNDQDARAVQGVAATCGLPST